VGEGGQKRQSSHIYEIIVCNNHHSENRVQTL
jgi:hypothetical protein